MIEDFELPDFEDELHQAIYFDFLKHLCPPGYIEHAKSKLELNNLSKENK